MEILKKRILKDSIVLPGNIIKVGSFLNHMVDIELMKEIGEEFTRIFGPAKPSKILTIEAAGIPIAAMTALALNIPFIIAKKYDSIEFVNPAEDYAAKVTSYTKKSQHIIRVSKAFIDSDDKVLVLDDILANGDAAKGLIDIISQSKAELVGFGACIEKSFQEGAAELKAIGINLHSLVRVKSLDGGVISFH